MIEGHLSPDPVRTRAGLRHALRRRFPKDLLHAGRGGQRTHRHVQDIGHHPQRKQNLSHIVHRSHQPADLPRVSRVGDPQKDYDSQIHGQIDERPEHRHDTHGGYAGPGEVPCGVREFFLLSRFRPECLDHPDGGQKLPAHRV